MTPLVLKLTWADQKLPRLPSRDNSTARGPTLDWSPGRELCLQFVVGPPCKIQFPAKQARGQLLWSQVAQHGPTMTIVTSHKGFGKSNSIKFILSHDQVWSHFARLRYLALVVLVVSSQSVLPRLNPREETEAQRIALFVWCFSALWSGRC